jgi:hypothetical protein
MRINLPAACLISALAGTAGAQLAEHITAEQAMAYRVRAYTLTDLRIGAVLRELMTDGRMSFGEAKAYIIANGELVKDLVMKQAADNRPGQ